MRSSGAHGSPGLLAPRHVEGGHGEDGDHVQKMRRVEETMWRMQSAMLKSVVRIMIELL